LQKRPYRKWRIQVPYEQDVSWQAQPGSSGTAGNRSRLGREIRVAIENDIVLLHFEDQPVVFARIEAIVADVKPDWYQVTLLLLKVPLQTVTWILRDVYIDGEEFTMSGNRVRLVKVESPDAAAAGADSDLEDALPQDAETGKVISLFDAKPK
jgi:hypothetical protein